MDPITIGTLLTVGWKLGSSIGKTLRDVQDRNEREAEREAHKNAYYDFYVQNKTNREIRIALHWKKQHRWITEYWWTAKPYEKIYLLGEVARCQNGILYLHAYDIEDNSIWGTENAYSEKIGDKVREFFEINMGSKYCCYTQGLTSSS